MKVQVKRQTMAKYRELVELLGAAAEFEDAVPATLPGVHFKGVYTDHFKNEVVVAWPIDRPPEAQDDFAKKYCLGGEPVAEMEREVKKSHLSLVKDQPNEAN